MTKVAAAGELPSSNALHFGGSSKIPSAIMKRKTPSELRGELLKRNKFPELVGESSAPVTSFTRNTDGAVSGPKKPDLSKAPRYIDTHIPYVVTKNSIRNRLLSRKENPKEAVSRENVGSSKNSGVPMNLYAKRQVQNSSLDVTTALGGKDYTNEAVNASMKCSNVTFPSLRGLFSEGEKLNGSSDVDMDKTFKGMLSCQHKSIDRTEHIMPQNYCSEFLLPGHKIPLDLTLKSNMRLQSSSSVNWFHRLINCGTVKSIACVRSQSTTSSSEPTSTTQVTNLGAFHSWVHPQSTLPRSAISALSVAGDFLLKRHSAWEDSFRSLYYMFRKRICKIFYVCTEQFVVLFSASDGSKETKCSCSAYVSQSTRNLRSLLKEHDVSFLMPLCHSKVEEVTAEDLVELSEIAKHNLGQTRATETLTGVDNSPQSLLMFTGNKNVHGLYDFLLNYRVFLSSLTGDDVPVLYSPVPFDNAALSAPEIRCKEVRRVDYTSNKDSEPHRSSIAGISYSVEITDACLPPWIVSDVCNAMRSNGGDFEASFKTKSTSIGLNVGLCIAGDQPAQQVMTDETTEENGPPFGILNATVSPHLDSAYLHGLKYGGVSYTASLSRVT
ncbi:hypothetical protein ACJIZ3_023966 [Penstemon smallii]|uniref:Protein downstream neighbor of Son n=1 Tax=Penstemon smallii TaxID=265156 RepID=A0ABD3TQP8_9LAMI